MRDQNETQLINSLAQPHKTSPGNRWDTGKLHNQMASLGAHVRSNRRVLSLTQSYQISTAKLLTRDEKRQIAVNVAKRRDVQQTNYKFV